VKSAATTRVWFASALLLAAALLCNPLVAQSATDSPDTVSAITCSRSVMITAEGPRKGEAPSRYLNVQGLSSRGNSKFASFGIIDFIVEPAPSTAAGRMAKLTLVLTQSIPPFAKPGRLLLFITGDPDEDVAGLKFATGGDTPLGAAASGAIPCGEATFTIDATGRKDRFNLELPEKARPTIDRIIGEGGRLRLIVAPGEADVAATYFGVDQQEADVRPSLIVE